MKTPEELTEHLEKALGANLKTVALFGSAASGDRTQKYSDYNVLLVLGEIGLTTLKTLAPLSRAWQKAGNPAPLLFTEDRIRASADVFPIEFLDIKASHRVLFGEDPFAPVFIDTHDLRHQLEYELRGKLIQLRQRYMDAAGKPDDVAVLVEKSLSTFAALFKAVLRLVGEEAPARRAQMFAALKKHVAIDEEALGQILQRRDNKRTAVPADELFSRLLDTVERVIDFVNQYKGKEATR